MERLGTILSGLGMLVLFALILLLAYYATTWISKKSSGQNGPHGCIRILDRIYLGQDKTLVLVKVGEKVLLLGVTSHHVEQLCEIDPADLPAQGGEESFVVGDHRFSQLLQQSVKNNWGRNSSSEKKGNADDGEI